MNGLKPLLRNYGTQPQSCHDVERRGHKQWPATIGRNTNDKPWKWVISGDLSTFWINTSEFWKEWEASCIFLPLYKCKNYGSVLFGSRFQVLWCRFKIMSHIMVCSIQNISFHKHGTSISPLSVWNYETTARTKHDLLRPLPTLPLNNETYPYH